MTVAQGTPKYRAGDNLGEDVKFAFARVNQLEAENAALSAQVVELQKELATLNHIRNLGSMFEPPAGEGPA